MSADQNLEEGTASQVPGNLRQETNSGLGNSPLSLPLIIGVPIKSCYVSGLNIWMKIKNNTWRFTFMINIIGLLLDPLLLYMPGINDFDVCIQFDKIFGIVACILLTVFDFHYIILKLHDGLRKGKRRYFLLLFQVASLLPISQVTVMIMIIRRAGSMTLWAALYFSLLLKHVRRLLPVLRWSRKAITSGKLADWSLMFCLCNLYFSQLYGAFWYLLAIYRQFQCWNEACEHNPECFSHLFTCDRKYSVTRIGRHCNIRTHNYGIALEALEYGFLDADVSPLIKIFYCFRQGLQNLSSFGQNLEVGTDSLGNVYAILVIVFGILSFSFLVGMIQIYQQSSIKRIVAKEKEKKNLHEKEKNLHEKLQEIERWLIFQKISPDLRLQIMEYKHDDWQETKVVNLENILNYLPKGIRGKLTRELCLEMLKKVVDIRKWGKASLEELCDYVKPDFYVERTRIICKGDPLDEIIFVVQCNLWTYTSIDITSASPRTNRLNCSHKNGHMKGGDFFGEELFSWIRDDPYTTDLPISTKTIQAITNVEALVLMAYDLKNLFIKRHEAAVISLQSSWRLRTRLCSKRNAETPSQVLIEHHPCNHDSE